MRVRWDVACLAIAVVFTAIGIAAWANDRSSEQAAVADPPPSVVPVADETTVPSSAPQTTATPTPTTTVLPLHGAASVDVGATTACAAELDGTVQCWEKGAVAKGVPGISGATLVAVNAIQACAVVGGGAVDCWPLGLFAKDTAYGGAAPVSGLNGVTAIAADGSTTCVIVGGRVKCWGLGNEVGQLGDGTKEPRANVVSVKGVEEVTGLAVSDLSPCAYSTTREYCWGSLVSKAKVFVNLESGDLSWARGNGYDCGLNMLGVTCTGDNRYGALGLPGAKAERSQPLGSATDVRQLAGGSTFACALRPGTVTCWGTDGSGGAGERARPRQVQGLTSAESIAGEADWACAVVAGGGVDCWNAEATSVDAVNAYA